MSNSMKRLPVGQEDFRYMIENGYYFVDKTLFIKELMNNHGFVNLITRPRRFGKTLNMNMLQYFLEKSAENPFRLFEGLKIMEEKELCVRHMGSYPVISLTLMNAKRDTFEDAVSSLKYTIAEEFNRHKEAVDSYSGQNSEFKEQIGRILARSKEDINDYAESLRLLSKILHDYYGKKVIILIDEYDVPLHSAHFNGYYNKMLDFIRAFLNFALKSNPNLEFAVLTGCLKLSQESVFTGLNNFEIYSLLTPELDQHFGFLPEEVLEILKYYHLSDKQEEMKEWFDGYKIGSYEIYNPWSVIKQVREYSNRSGEAKPHWANTSSNDMVKALIKKSESSYTIKAEIEELMDGKAIEKTIDIDLTYGDALGKIENLWTFLYFTGYLTADQIRYANGICSAELRIPNTEVQYIFKNQIMEWFDQTTIAFSEQIFRALEQRDGGQLQNSLNELLFSSISYMDYNENYYHGIMVGLLVNSPYILKSNREAGLGRADITLVDQNTAIIIELKVAGHAKGLKAVCREAVKQINEMQYADEFAQNNIIKIGIAFYKKTCAVIIE